MKKTSWNGAVSGVCLRVDCGMLVGVPCNPCSLLPCATVPPPLPFPISYPHPDSSTSFFISEQKACGAWCSRSTMDSGLLTADGITWESTGKPHLPNWSRAHTESVSALGYTGRGRSTAHSGLRSGVLEATQETSPYCGRRSQLALSQSQSLPSRENQRRRERSESYRKGYSPADLPSSETEHSAHFRG